MIITDLTYDVIRPIKITNFIKKYKTQASK